MKLLIVSATQEEIQPLKKSFGSIKQVNNCLERVSANNITIDFLVSGVGMVPTAFCLGKVLSVEKYDFALNLGIAGSFNYDYNIGDVVNVATELFAELGIEDNNSFVPLYKLNLLNDFRNISIDGKMFNRTKTENKYILNLPCVNGITVNTVHGKYESIENIKRIFNPDIESMEGAAFFYSCLKENIGFAEIRAISNYVEPRNKSTWNITKAIENLNYKALEIINSI